MPGLLKSDAKCPICGQELVALVDTTNSYGVTREYFHPKGTRKCIKRFRQQDIAHIERQQLEVHI